MRPNPLICRAVPCFFHRLYEVFEEGQEFYIVTELVQGGELFDRIVSKSHYSEKECRDLVKVLLTTLEYMHGNNVVHRDLKPENLLLMSGAYSCGGHMYLRPRLTPSPLFLCRLG